MGVCGFISGCMHERERALGVTVFPSGNVLAGMDQI